MYQFHTDHPTPNVYLDVARGAISNSKIVHKFGANFDIDQATDPESVWTGSGLYPWSSLATAQTIYCLSTSASDTAVLTIEGLDANYDEQTETVTLTGASAVTTTNTFIRVFRMTYEDGANVGTITARTVSASGTVVAQIDIGYAQTLMAVYTVPAGHTGYLVALDSTIDSNKNAQLLMYHRLFGKPFRIAHVAETSGHYRYDFHAPLRVPEKTDIDIRIDNVSGNDSRVTANFDIVLIRD
jgi:hypothetical protein